MENWKESPHSYGTHMNPSGNQPLYQCYNQGGYQTSEAYPHQNQGFGSFQNVQRLQNPNPFQTDNQLGFVLVPSEQSLPGFSYVDQSLGSFKLEQRSQSPKPSHADNHRFISTDHKQTMQNAPKEQQQGWMPPQDKKEQGMSGSSTDSHEFGKAHIKGTGKVDGQKSRWNVTGEGSSTAVETSVAPASHCVPPSSGLRVRINRNKALSDYIIIEYLKQFGKCSIARASKNNNRARIVTFESLDEGQAAVDAGQQNRTGRKRYSVHNIQGKTIALQLLDTTDEEHQEQHSKPKPGFFKMLKEMNLDEHNALVVRNIRNTPDEPILAYFREYGPCQLYRKQRGFTTGRLHFFEAPGAADAVLKTGRIKMRKKNRSRPKSLISNHHININGKKREVAVEVIPGHKKRELCTCKWNTQGSVQPHPPDHDDEDADEKEEEDNDDDEEDGDNDNAVGDKEISNM